MNVTSTSMPAPRLGAGGSAGSSASPLAALLKSPTTSAASAAQSKRDAEGSAPGPDVAKKLKALGEQFLAIMLIQDPAARAKAAAGLYKQYAQTAKEYAGATADGRAAAQAASAAYQADPSAIAKDPNAPAADSIDPDAQAAVADPATAAAAPADTTAGADDAAAQQAAAQQTSPQVSDDQLSADPATPQGAPVLYTAGKKPNFVADLYMEQIKMFAKATHQVYDQAIEETRKKKADKGEGHGLDKEMKAARDDLTDAAKAVEGPAATAEGYDPLGASMPAADPPAAVSITA